MNTKYKYFHFDLARPIQLKQKTQTWFCVSNSDDSFLAVIKWFPRWRQYCFFPEEGTVFSQSCLEDINNFLNQLKEIRNEQRKK